MTLMSELAAADLEALKFGRRTHFDHYGGRPLSFASLRGQGIEIEAIDLDGGTGERLTLLDASGGYGSACLGAGHPAVRAALHRAVDEVGYVTDEIGSLERSRLLHLLLGPDGLWRDQFPDEQYRVSGRNSGSEGLELALRLVLESRFDPRRLRVRPGMESRDTILAFEGARHGWTHGLVPMLNRRHYRVGLPGPAPAAAHGVRVEHLPFGDPDALDEYLQENGHRLLAVFVEPVQGDAGILRPPPQYLRTLSDRCRERGVLVVADEVLTFAKTGQFFAMADAEGPVPTDITVVGKSLGMGVLSTSMVISRQGLGIRATGAVSTSDLRPLTCAVIRDGLSFIVAEDLLARSAALGRQLSQRLWADLVEAFPDVWLETRGTGVMHGVEVTPEAAVALPDLRLSLIRAGVYVEFMAGAGRRSGELRYVHPTMRVAPPLITTPDQVDEIVARLAEGTDRFRASR